MKLMVSHDAGGSYYQEDTGSLVELQARAKELRLDEQWLRWVIESDDGQEIADVSAIHKGILDFMEQVNAK
jgi:hypothetical protein